MAYRQMTIVEDELARIQELNMILRQYQESPMRFNLWNSGSEAEQLSKIYEYSVPSLAPHSKLQALINEAAGQEVPLMHVLLTAALRSRNSWFETIDGLGEASRALNMQRGTVFLRLSRRMKEDLDAQMPSIEQPVSARTMFELSELKMRMEDARQRVLNMRPPPRGSMLASVIYVDEYANMRGDMSISEYIVHLAAQWLAIPLSCANEMSEMGMFAFLNGRDMNVINRRVRFYRYAAALVNYLVNWA